MTSRIVLTVVLAALAAGTTACGASPKEISLERATKEIRAEAAKLRDHFHGALTGGKSEEEIVGPLGPQRELGRRTTADGFEVDAVLYSRAEAGGGGTYDSVSLRLCVRYAVHQRPDPKVDLSDLDCPASLPTAIEGYGEIDRTVRLDD